MQSDMLNKKINASIKTIEIFRDFYPAFKSSFGKLRNETVLQLEHQLYKNFDDKKKHLLLRLASIESPAYNDLDDDDKQKLIFQTYELTKQFDNILDTVYQMVDVFSVKDNVFVDSELTESSKQQNINAEKVLKRYFITFTKTYHNTTTDKDITWRYFNMLLATLDLDKGVTPSDSPTNIIDGLTNINSLYRKYRNTLNLYAYFLQYLLDKFFRDRVIINHIMGMIEDDKTFALQNTKASSSVVKKGHQNPFIRKFGLVPYTGFLPLSVLFNNKKITNIKNVAKHINFPVIVIKYITNNPVSYDLWNLVDYYKAKNLGLDPNASDKGVDENLVKRMKTIIVDDATSSTKIKWDFSSCVLLKPKGFNVSTNKEFYVLETLNNNTFRFLNYYILRGDRPGATIHQSKIRPLLRYLKIQPYDDELKNSRVSAYQHDVVAMSIENLFFKNKKPDIEMLTKDSKIEIDSKKVLTQSIFKLMTVVKKELPKRKSYPNPIVYIGLIVHSSKLFAAFIDTVVKLYRDFYSSDVSKNTNFKFSEVLCTYMVEIKNIRLIFAKELHNEYIDIIEKHKEDKSAIEALKTRIDIEQYIEAMINKVLHLIITPDNNIYQALSFKSNLLQVNL